MESLGLSKRALYPGRTVTFTKQGIITFGLIPFTLFAFSFGLRLWFFSGFILGDDLEEFALIKEILEKGPTFLGHLQYRFTMWLFNVLSFKWFGISEAAFFLPTWIMSASLGPIGYLILIRWGHRRPGAILGGMLIASAPFEVLIGTLRANDLILSWFLALALWAFFYFEDRPEPQGAALAIFLWLAFYTKLWTVYLFPAVGIYYLVQFLRKRAWRGWATFTLYSAFLHAVAASFWKLKIGSYFPFFHSLSATYPVASHDLLLLFWQYPRMVLVGSEFGTTLFGMVPYLLFALLLIKALSTFLKRRFSRFSLDRIDLILLVYYGSFFLLMNFFPNNFKFDQYYSAPRIFRYLTPLSFPMSLHLAKLLLDLGKIDSGRTPVRRAVVPSLLAVLILVNLYQADDGTQPGQIYYKALRSIIADVKAQSPPKLLTEAWLHFFLKEIYLKEEGKKTSLTPIVGTHSVKEYEEWLNHNETALPEGTLLLTGLGSYVHYGAHYDGFRLRQFTENLDPRWTLVKEYGMLDYLPLPEPARLWKFSGSASFQEPESDLLRKVRALDNVDALYEAGMRHFDQGQNWKARLYYKKIIDRFPDSHRGGDALYYHAICYYRETDWTATITEFQKLIEKYPQSSWISGAHYHMGVSYRQLGDIEQARKEFQYVIDHFSSDTHVAGLAKQAMNQLPP